MVGKLFKTKDGWFVFQTNVGDVWSNDIPVHPSQVDNLQSSISTMIDNDGKIVEFEIIDEFTHPELFNSLGWGDGTPHAWISQGIKQAWISEKINLTKKDSEIFVESLNNPPKPNKYLLSLKKLLKF